MNLDTNNPQELFNFTLQKLKDNIATRCILERVQDPQYDQQLGIEMCSLIFSLCEKNESIYQQRINNFISFCHEFLRLQAELERTERYHFSTFEEAKKEIYDNPAVMENRYLYGLLFSQAFWINHNKIFQLFRNNFCNSLSKKGTVLEVPIGTGIFLATFLQQNPAWIAKGYDISPSAVTLSLKVLSAILGKSSLSTLSSVLLEDIFKVTENKTYDRIICGLLLDNVEDPHQLLQKLSQLLAPGGKIFLTTNAWASTIDHLYLFRSVQEIKQLLEQYFSIEQDLALSILASKKPEEEKTPVNYACILTRKS